MVRKLEITEIENDLASVRALLSRRSPERDPIGFAQFRARAEALERELDSKRRETDHRASVALFFTGAPVLGSRGVRADFAGKAVDIFQDLVSKQFASVELGQFGQRGPVPLKSSSDMLVTDVARGSVGFILEEADQNESLTNSQLSIALDKIASDIAATSAEDTEPFEDLMSDIDPRYFGALSNFFQHLDDSHATLRLVEGQTEIELPPAAVRRARERTESAVLKDDESVQMKGRLFLLPAHKKFELVVSGASAAAIVYGNVSSEFAKQHLEELTRRNDVVGKEWEVRLRSRTITRPNRDPITKYTLLGLIRVAPRK